MSEERAVKLPVGLLYARRSGTLNSERLLNFIFSEIDYLVYPLQPNKRIVITSSEWGEALSLKQPTTSLKSGAEKLYNTTFKFQFDPTKEYKMIKEMEYDEGVLTLSLNLDFLTAAMRDEDGAMNPVLDLLYGTT